MLALLDYLSDKARTAFYKALLEGLLASDKISESDKERLKDFGSITLIETEAEREGISGSENFRSEVIYTLYGESKEMKSTNGEVLVYLRNTFTVKESVVISVY